MRRKELSKIHNKIEDDGLEYTMLWASNWSEVEDDEFHALRKRYIEVRKELAVFLGVEP
jgi:hypothetical protein